MLGPSYVDKDLVFARPDGQPTHPEHFSMAFDRRVARYKLPRIRLHDLRHTWATLALAAGVDVKIVSEARPRQRQDHLGHLPACHADDAAGRSGDGRAANFRPH